MTLPIGLLLAACMAVRAGRGECVRYNSADWTAGRREKLRTSSAAQHSPNT